MLVLTLGPSLAAFVTISRRGRSTKNWSFVLVRNFIWPWIYVPRASFDIGNTIRLGCCFETFTSNIFNVPTLQLWACLAACWFITSYSEDRILHFHAIFSLSAVVIAGLAVEVRLLPYYPHRETHAQYNIRPHSSGALSYFQMHACFSWISLWICISKLAHSFRWR